MPSVLEETAQRLGLSVSDLTQKLEAERVTRGPGGRDVMLDVIDDNRRRPMGGGPCGMLPNSPIVRARPRVEPNRTGWTTPAPIASPPGQELIARILEADTERQRLETSDGRRAKAEALIKQAEALLATAPEEGRVKLMAFIEESRAGLAKL
jgi:hypothetical protein